MNLPAGVRELTTVDEVREVWGDLFTVDLDDGPAVSFHGNSRVAICDDAVYVRLRRPVSVIGGSGLELVDVLRVPEPTVRDLRASDRGKTNTEKSIAMLAILCGITNAEIEKMTAADMSLIGDVIGAFLSE